MAGTVNTPVDMANLALSHLKEPAIKAFDYSSVPSRWFVNNYAAKRDAFLAMHEWDFAMALDSLAALATPPPFRWDVQYTLPADCLRVPAQTENGERNGKEIPIEVIGNKLMTNWRAPFQLRYVQRVEHESAFSPLFVNAFSYFLAEGAAHVVAGKNSLVQTMADRARAALDQAQTVDAMQSTDQPHIDQKIIEDR